MKDKTVPGAAPDRARFPPEASDPAGPARPRRCIAAADAFSEIAALRGSVYAPEAALIDSDPLRSWEGVAAIARNDFEPVVLRRIPRLGDGLAALRNAGARIALLAGSDSSIFGVFDDARARDAVADAVEASGMRT